MYQQKMIIFQFKSILLSTNTQHSGRIVKDCQTESLVEIYSKSQVRAIGKVLLVKFS